MAFYPVLRNLDETAFLLHVETDGNRLSAAVLVSEPYMNSQWLQMSAIPGLEGEILIVQMPVEIIGQPERYKGYDLTLPFRRNNE